MENLSLLIPTTTTSEDFTKKARYTLDELIAYASNGFPGEFASVPQASSFVVERRQTHNSVTGVMEEKDLVRIGYYSKPENQLWARTDGYSVQRYAGKEGETLVYLDGARRFQLEKPSALIEKNASGRRYDDASTKLSVLINYVFLLRGGILHLPNPPQGDILDQFEGMCGRFYKAIVLGQTPQSPRWMLPEPVQNEPREQVARASAGHLGYQILGYQGNELAANDGTCHEMASRMKQQGITSTIPSRIQAQRPASSTESTRLHDIVESLQASMEKLRKNHKDEVDNLNKKLQEQKHQLVIASQKARRDWEGLGPTRSDSMKFRDEVDIWMGKSEEWQYKYTQLQGEYIQLEARFHEAKEQARSLSEKEGNAQKTIEKIRVLLGRKDH